MISLVIKDRVDKIKASVCERERAKVVSERENLKKNVI